MSQNPGWQEVDRLIAEQKFEAAISKIGELRTAARTAVDDPEWTRALIREVQLRTALHGYETAVRFLRDEPWPQTPKYRLALGLFYARSLVTYLRSYSWEINQRERVASDDELDLKAWTAEQIGAEAHRAYAEIWAERETWGGESLGDLAEYVEQNDYPPRIRGTLRDAVTYLWVELLADTSLWRPEQSNDLFRLDFARLLEGEPKKSAQLDLASPDVHPLLKIGALLDDLETWHRDHDRPEAAFEARLERLRRLSESFTRPDDRAALLAELERGLDDLGRRFEWWSVGMAWRAELVRDTDAPDALIRAREIALEGAEAHPSSIGGRRCRAIVAQIEAPSYALAAMATDGPDRRSIEVSHQNLTALHFRAYKIDLLAAIRNAKDRSLLPDYREVERIVGSQRPDAEWSAELPPTPDYRTHRTYLTPPLQAPGVFLLVASARRDFKPEGNQLIGLNLILSDLVLLTRRDEKGYEVTVRSGRSGQALAGVEVDIYRFDWRAGHQRLATATTDNEGRVRFDASGWDRNPRFLLARRGAEVALDATYLHQNREPQPAEQTSALIYTDRSVYRPGQKVLWKVVAYHGSGERFATSPGTALTLELRDPNGESVASLAATTNDFGSAAGEVVIPSGRLLGSWVLGTSLGGNSEIVVEEYKRPTFEVTIREPKTPLRLNREATLEGEARYYFGLPVASGEVTWRVTREPIYPRWWWWPQPQSAPQTIATGIATVDAEGVFRLSFTPEADEREAKPPGRSYNYRLSADLTDEGGETRSATRVFRLGFVAVEATVASDRGFFRAGEPAALEVRRTDLDGVARPGKGSYRLIALAQPAETRLPADQPLPEPPEKKEPDRFQTPGDRLRPRWDASASPEEMLRSWSDGETLRDGKLEHDAQGLARVDLAGLAPGAYRLRYRTEDDFGAAYELTHELLVAPTAKKAAALALPVLLLAEKETVAVGETARFLVGSGLAEQELELELHRDGQPFERRRLSSREGWQVIEIPVDARLRGGFGAVLSGVRDHQRLEQRQNVNVPWDDRRLAVEFATFRDRLRPGAKETWRITVRGDDEKLLGEGAAELLAYMYDRSLDVFAPHHPPDPLNLLPTSHRALYLQFSLGISPLVWQQGQGMWPTVEYPTLRGDLLKFYDGYAMGGPGVRGNKMLPMRSMSEMRMAPALEAAPAAQLALTDSAEEAVAAAAPPRDGSGADETAQEPVELRSDFAETAFWEPHLILGDDGAVSFEFEVPDSVTEWNVWAHALTKDLRAGSVTKQTRTVKELLVRPYLPRFLREGDRAEIKVVVNNAGNQPFEGRLDFDVVDPETEKSLLADFGLERAKAMQVPFSVPAGGGVDLAFPVVAPARVGTVAFRVVARAGDLSDGELRPLPVLPARLHLAQSRFAALSERDSRTLVFEDLKKNDDPTRQDEQLVVTLDAQLFYSLLSALPYLVDYPYECTEQTLNRFLSTGILSSLYDRYPAVAAMAKEFSQRETQFETWDAADPNRKMTLEETPWLQTARGGKAPGADLVKVLDPKIAAAERTASLAKLEKSQTANGGFPWWPGGPPSPYMTLYLAYGFAKALEFEVEIPQDMVVRAWGYLHQHYLDEWAREMIKGETGWEFITFLSYVLSSYPDPSWTGGVFTDDDRARMLAFSFAHWKQHSPMLKGQLALTLERAGRGKDAQLVWDSVMDSAKTDRDLGTYWAPEDRSWLWYNDTIETHAAALRTLTELEPKDARRHGLVQWLMLNKKLNHWKSTRATAEVIYSVAHYLEKEGTLGAREEATVTIGARKEHFVFEPDRYTGKKNQIVLGPGEIDPKTSSTIEVSKQTPGLLFVSATWHFATDQLPEEARGDFFSVERKYFKRRHDGRDWVLDPLAEGARVEVGDEVEVQLSLRAKHAAEYVHLRDPRGAGFEPQETRSGYEWDLGIAVYREIRDSGTNFFFEWLPVGEYTFKYRLRASHAGSFRVGPAQIQSMYAPEFVGYSAGAQMAIETP